MASRRELVLQEFVKVLRGPDAPAALNVHRFRTRAIQKDELPAAVVYDAGQDNTAGATNAVDRDLRVAVELRVQASAQESPDEALDPFYVWTVKALMEDETLGGVAQMIDETGDETDAAEAGRIYGARRIVFEVRYITLRDDPETAA